MRLGANVAIVAGLFVGGAAFGGCGLATSGLLDPPSSNIAHEPIDSGAKAKESDGAAGAVDGGAPLADAGGEPFDGGAVDSAGPVADACASTADAAAASTLLRIAAPPK